MINITRISNSSAGCYQVIIYNSITLDLMLISRALLYILNDVCPNMNPMFCMKEKPEEGTYKATGLYHKTKYAKKGGKKF